MFGKSDSKNKRKTTFFRNNPPLHDGNDISQRDSPLYDYASFLDSYVPDKELRCSGNNSVYLAWHKRLCKYVVIKESVCNLGSSRINRNEVEALKDIKCVSVPQVLDFHMNSDKSFTILEYIPGESFDTLMHKGATFSTTQISKWFLTLASSLAVIHKHDVCHRDIKPANIILSPCDDVYLIDFDSALVKSNYTGIISCSLAYASPEQCEYFNFCVATGKSETASLKRNVAYTTSLTNCATDMVAEKEIVYRPMAEDIDWKLSDIYSLGATMYHLFFGVRPPPIIHENTVFPTSRRHPSPISDIIVKCMKFNPQERFASAQELCNTLL